MPNNTKEIIPAIMPRSFQELQDLVARVASFAETVQIDIMDGVFVPSMSWPYINKSEQWGELSMELPGGIYYEAHLMVQEPEVISDSLVKMGVGRIIVHAEVATPEICDRIKTSGAREVVLALNLDTPLESIGEFRECVDGVLLMGIARVGYQGEAFDERVIARVVEVRAHFPEMVIAVDGGVSTSNSAALYEAGATRQAVGSFLFSSENIEERYQELSNVE